jgi:inner membrane protein
MFLKTHLLIALFLVLAFFSYISNPLIFLPVAFIGTILPDIDSRFSKIGKRKIFRIFNFFMKHRGIMHSFTFLFLVSSLLFLTFREALLPFAASYSLHLVLDALTIQGIPIFYPLKFRIRGKLKTGGLLETIFFVFFLLADLFLLFLLLFSKIYLIVK